MAKIKPWHWIAGSFALIVLLGLSKNLFEPIAPATADPPAEQPRVSARFSQVRTIAPDTYAVVFSSEASRDDVEVEARKRCSGKQWCKVLGWTDPDYVATAMPMTDREVSRQVFALTINRASGLDEAVWSSQSTGTEG